MKTRTYLMLFIAASLGVIAGVLSKIQKVDGGDYILGISLLVQVALIVGFVIQKTFVDSKHNNNF